MASFDTNLDSAINPEDMIDVTTYAFIMDSCDLNNDGSVDACETFTCA
jgi:hypothetical protein